MFSRGHCQSQPGLFSFFLEQGFDKVCGSFKPSNCLSSLMCSFEDGGFACFRVRNCPRHTVLNIFYLISAQKIKMLDGHLRLPPACRAAILDPKARKKGLKFDNF